MVIAAARGWLVPVAVIAALSLSAMAGWQGYRYGRFTERATANSDKLLAIEAAEKADAERRKLAEERADIARKLEEAAYAEPASVDQCLSPGRVQRLNAIR